MNSNFFEKKKITIKKIFPEVKFQNDFIIKDIKPLTSANQNDISFFDSFKYKEDALNTKASVCITTETLSKFLPKSTYPVLVKNVLLELAKTLKKLYPKADIDHPDFSLKKPSAKIYKSVKFGNNVLIGKNVKIGKNSEIGANTIIEKNVVIGKNCIIGSNVIIKNSIFGERVVIQDNCKIGQKGFGFIPVKDDNIKFPHSDNVEIASGCTIDRGSVDDTTIGKNTYLDNQVHVAHNVKIGSNCMIAGQVGFAGSTKVGNNVSIGGQAGISGHLIIGNNVKIGGGSGVVKDIGDNQIVMGYPAVPLKEFLKKKYDKERDR